MTTLHAEKVSKKRQNLGRLYGKFFLLTQPEPQSRLFTKRLELHGGHVISCPTIKIMPTKHPIDLSLNRETVNHFDWIIFTSKNTVRFFFKQYKGNEFANRTIKTCKICAVGPETAKLLKTYGVSVDLIPKNYTAEGIVEAFESQNETSLTILYPRGDKARNVINESLITQGHKIYSPVLYRTLPTDKLPEPALKALKQKRVDCFVFTAPSTIENLATMLGKEHFVRMLATATVASIGPITSQACRRYGLSVDIQPEAYSMEALSEEILRQSNLLNK